MTAKRWVAVVVLLALVACWLGCNSNQSTGGNVGSYYVKGEGYKSK